MMKRKRAKLRSALPARIIGDGSMAGPVREGMNIPVLVVDATNIPAIREAIQSANYEPDGDVKTAWAEDRKSRNLLLHVVLQRPTPAEFVVIFNMPKEGILIDGLLEARGFYLKAGKPGDSFKSTFDDASILVDVPPSQFNESWPARYRGSMMEEFRRRGLGSKEARAAAEKTYVDVRQITTFRMPSSPAAAPGESLNEA